jgi:uncharacterized protein (UPF0335 family)
MAGVTKMMAPLSPQPDGKKPKEKPADPLTVAANQEHARAAREGHNSVAVALDFGARMAATLDELDIEIKTLNMRKSAIYGELRRRGYDLDAFRYTMRESRIDPLTRAARDRKRTVYAAIPMPPRDDGGAK